MSIDKTIDRALDSLKAHKCKPTHLILGQKAAKKFKQYLNKGIPYKYKYENLSTVKYLSLNIVEVSNPDTFLIAEEKNAR